MVALLPPPHKTEVGDHDHKKVENTYPNDLCDNLIPTSHKHVNTYKILLGKTFMIKIITTLGILKRKGRCCFCQNHQPSLVVEVAVRNNSVLNESGCRVFYRGSGGGVA